MKGNFGRILRVDLSRGETKAETLDESVYRQFIGGVGLAAKIIYDEVGPEVEPLAPENRLVFAVGPFQGTSIPGTGRWSVAARSPLTGIWGEAGGGGYWGPIFKRTGYDALVIQGRAPKPVYLWIHDGEAEIKDASHLWGLDTFEAEKAIKEDHKGLVVSVASIGQAGEKLVKISAIVSDEGHGVAARSGLGAVMGSKRLKAVAVSGKKRVEVAEPEILKELVEELTMQVRIGAKDFRDHGTPFFVETANDLGDLPVKNWTLPDWDGAERLGAPYYTEKVLVKGVACSPCPIACHRHVRIQSPSKYAFEGMGPEYESIAMLGSQCLVDDLAAVVKANELCNRYGIDTISGGAIISFLMECYERGWLTAKDTGGLALKWGDGDAVIDMVKKISLREGLGDVAAEGIKVAAEKIHKGAPAIACHVKGLDIPAHDPRAFYSLALNYATGNRGACHLRGGPHVVDFGMTIPEGGVTAIPYSTGTLKDRFSLDHGRKSYITMKVQDLDALYDSLVQCKFMGWGGLSATDQANLLCLVTGWEVTPQEFMTIGERIFNLQRAFNVRLGVTRKDDTLPPRMFEASKTGNREGRAPVLEPMLNEYYKQRGWDQDGRPGKEKLEELGLGEAGRISRA